VVRKHSKEKESLSNHHKSDDIIPIESGENSSKNKGKENEDEYLKVS